MEDQALEAPAQPDHSHEMLRMAQGELQSLRERVQEMEILAEVLRTRLRERDEEVTQTRVFASRLNIQLTQLQTAITSSSSSVPFSSLQ